MFKMKILVFDLFEYYLIIFIEELRSLKKKSFQSCFLMKYLQKIHNRLKNKVIQKLRIRNKSWAYLSGVPEDSLCLDALVDFFLPLAFASLDGVCG